MTVRDKTKTASDEAMKVRELYGLIGAAVDPVDVANELGIQVYEKSNLRISQHNVSGAIVKKNNEIKIYVNAEENNRRKRFTIAHELGHYFLGHLDNKDQCIDLRDDIYTNQSCKEIAANDFAGNLLMDKKEVRNRFERSKSIGMGESQIITLLADIFLVSRAAMYTRLKKLELI